MTLVESITDWAIGLRDADIPGDVADLLRAQRRSVIGAVAASTDDPAVGRVARAVERWAAPGPCPLLGGSAGAGATSDLEPAVYAAVALSVALDFDDYVCFGHTGHTAVLVPILAAAETGGDGSDQLVAQAVANEIEARLGGAILLGPMNGQLWAYIQAAGAALATGLMLGLDRDRLAHALAISLAHPTRATVPGFMAPDSKLLVAAEPAAAGVRAARLAEAGVTGPLDALDDHRGVLDAFSFAPIRGVFAGLGEGWATKTLCVKPYPGCAYIDTTVDALLDVLSGGAVEPDDVDEIVVEAGMLTTGMNALSAPYAETEPPTPVTINFNIPWNAAIVVAAGQLTEAETHPDWLAEHAQALAKLRRKVRLSHDAELTALSASRFGGLIPAAGLAREVGVRRLASAARKVRAEHPATGLGIGDVVGFVRSARSSGAAATRAAASGREWWDPNALDRFAAAFPSRVTLRLAGGETRVAQADVPRGGAGNAEASPADVARTKLDRSGPRRFGVDGTAALQQAIDADDGKLHTLLAP
ncbi:MAG TPA: MmgE/PrpD family protein [Acidimicrobiia bacterium]|nr:MmgE/PrpD family protein [Acidimicrobiia bacterium]